MGVRTLLASRARAAAIIVGAALPLAAGLAGVSSVSADGASFPLYNATGSVGVVQMTTNGTSTTFNVTLMNALPETTYTVSSCQVNGDGTTACSTDADAEAASITTDANGNAQKSITLNVSQTDQVLVTNTGDSTDVAYAATSPGTVAPGAIPTEAPQS